MTEVNGLRLAYRGLVAGLAGGYVWAAMAMVLSALLHADPLRPLRPLAMALTPLAGTPELSFVLGLALVQGGGAFVGLCFAYFFARFFTVRGTVAAAAVAFAVLAWGIVGAVLADQHGFAAVTAHPGSILATVGFGTVLGAWVPVRGQVTR